MSRHPINLKPTTAVIFGAFLMGGLAACHRPESTANLLAEAKRYEQKGELKAALIQLKNAVEQSPQDGEARMQLATLDWELGDAVSADKELHKARSLGIGADRVLPLLGKAMLQESKFKELLDEITPVQAAHSSILLTARGEALLATGHAVDAKQAFDQALALNPNDGNALLGLSRCAILQKDIEGAQRLITSAVTKDPKNPDVWMANGTMLRATGKPDEALASFDEALKLKPDHRSAHLEKAYIQIARGKFPEAQVEINAADKASPNNPLVNYVRGLYEFSQGNYPAAYDQLQKVLKVAPEHMPSILLAGASELHLGSTQQAERHIRHFLDSNPNNVYARKLLAQILLQNAKPTDAALALAPVLKDPVQDAQLMALAGESYMQVHDFNKASNYFEKAAALAPKAAAVRTSLGLSRMAQGDQARGLSDLELATALDPKSTQATVALVQTELGLMHFDKALAAVQSLEKQQPQNPSVQNLKGAVYMAKNDHAAARAAFEKALSQQPNFFPAAVNLARLDMQENKPDAARGRFEKLLQTDKTNINAMIALGDLALAQNRTDEATSWFEKANNTKPEMIAPAVKLGMHYLRSQQPQKALTLARKYAISDPTSPDVLELLAQAQIANKDLPGVVETYSKLASVLPKSPEAQLRLAGAHIAMKNDTAAADDLKRAIELQPDFIPARLVQVDIATRAKRFDEALADAREIQKIKDNAALGYAIEGDVKMAQGKPAAAVEAYDKALAISKVYAVMIKSAKAMVADGKSKEAQERVAQWVKANPDDVRARLLLSDLYLASKAYKPAIAALEETQKRIPNNPLILNNLAWAYQHEKDPRALPTAEQAYKLASNDAGVMDTLGWILLDQGNTVRALPLLQKAHSLAPDAAEVSYHYAVGLNKSGDKQGARKELDKLLSQNKNFSQSDEARTLLKSL